MKRIIYPILLPLVILASASVSASGQTGAPYVSSPTWSDSNGVLVVASTYSGRRTDSLTQQRLRQNEATQTQTRSAEFSAFETDRKATTTPVRHQHRYGGRGHDRPRTQH